jgi:Protein of unknown function (DUF2815)
VTTKSKKKLETVQWLTPFGVARFPKISTPDIGGRYSDGKFKTMVIFADADLPAVKAAQEAAAAKLWPGLTRADLKLPLREFFDKNKEEGTETSAGWGITFKSKNRPLVLDAKKQKLPEGLKIGGGSEIRIGAAFAAYENADEVLIIENGTKRTETVIQKGLTVYLNSVQVRDLQQGARSDGSEFDEVSGGYEYDGSANAEATTSDATDL